MSACAPAAIRAAPIISQRCLPSMRNCSTRRSIGWRAAKATTMSHEFRPGEVFSYPYLWAWQQQRGETEGRKPRPVCVVIAIRSASDGNSHLALLAITTQPPQTGRIALEIPDIERKRAGLSDLKQCWIMVDEYSYDIV